MASDVLNRKEDCFVRVLQVILIAAIFAAPIPSGALSGKLGVQLNSAGNQLTGELPKEGTWNGRVGLGAGVVHFVGVAGRW